MAFYKVTLVNEEVDGDKEEEHKKIESTSQGFEEEGGEKGRKKKDKKAGQENMEGEEEEI